jgi:hypothetical protein
MPPTMTQSPNAQSPVVTFQGIDVPAEAVRPDAFYALTRRHRFQEFNKAFAGLGLTDNIELKKSDIIAGLHVRFSGQVVVTLGGGTAATTRRWPYDLVKAFRLTANGQSNLINISGLKAKARSAMAGLDFSDRGVSEQIGAAAVTQGTLALASELWGVGSGQAGIAGAPTTYPIELTWDIDIAEDERDLAGAIFAQTSTMDITLAVDYESAANLFVLTGAATAVLTGNLIVETEKFSIPVVGGQFVVPNLSLFHSIIQTRYSQVANGDNEIRIIGQGAGKQLLRLFYQTWNGALPAQLPLVANATNYGPQSWRYGTNETPETYLDGQSMRQINEREYAVDVGGVWGFLSHEFAVIAAFRDTVDMGQTSELRIVVNIPSALALTNPAIEYVQEVIFAAGS